MYEKSKHFTLDQRIAIQVGIESGKTKAEIADLINKDKSSVGKEVKNHRYCSHKCKFPVDCVNRSTYCYNQECNESCSNFEQFTCNRRDRSPGACNGCPQFQNCRHDKYIYSAKAAHDEYRKVLSDSLQGPNLTTSEAKTIADVVGPLLEQGHSPYTIVSSHPELGICEKTLYNYIETDALRFVGGVTVTDLRRQTGRKLSKKKAAKGYKKRSDNKYLKGREYSDYLEYMEQNPNLFVTQMDTVYNDVSNGPFIQTFKFLCCDVLFALSWDERTSENMVNGVRILDRILGPGIFQKYVNVLLTDRGSEFSAADEMETGENGIRRTRVFYCDPMRAGQKGSLENKHITLRYILPKGADLRKLGITDINAMKLVLSHVNSYPLEKLGGKTALEVTEFMFPDLYERLNEWGMRKINRDEVIVTPHLLKQFNTETN